VAKDSVGTHIHLFLMVCRVSALDAGFAGPYGVVRSVPSDGHAIDHPFAAILMTESTLRCPRRWCHSCMSAVAICECARRAFEPEKSLSNFGLSTWRCRRCHGRTYEHRVCIIVFEMPYACEYVILVMNFAGFGCKVNMCTLLRKHDKRGGCHEDPGCGVCLAG